VAGVDVRDLGAAGVSYEAEFGIPTGTASVVPCDSCSGGHKVTGIGSGEFNVLYLPVFSPTGGDTVLTVVGAAEGTRSVSVGVNFRPAGRTSMIGWSTSAPLVGKSLTVTLRRGLNVITLSNDAPGGTAPDLDKVVLG
jgi:hypothetical protein